ncbi:hypothetical protein GW17_00014916 [Ensete ventricosum]|nr:hypothetical protein GW17_00014916 [Ensete ventricosum]
MSGTYRSTRLPKSTIGGQLRKKKGRRGKGKKKKRGEERIPRQRRPRPPAVAARDRGRFFSRARRRSVSPHEETDRGDVPYRYGLCLKSNFVNEYLKHGLNISTSSSCSPISSSADECLRLKASSSARNPGKTAASACSLSHCL